MLFDPTSYFSFATVLKQNGGLFDVYVLAHFFHYSSLISFESLPNLRRQIFFQTGELIV